MRAFPNLQQLYKSPVGAQLIIQVSWLARNLFLTVLCTSYLADTEFAAFATYSAGLALFRPAAEFGLTTVAAQVIARRRRASLVRFATIRILIGAVVYVSIFLGAQLCFSSSLGLSPGLQAALCFGVATDVAPLLMSLAQQENLHAQLLKGMLIATGGLVFCGIIVAIVSPSLAGIVLLASGAGPVTSVCMLRQLLGYNQRPDDRGVFTAGVIKMCMMQVLTDFLLASHVPATIFLLACTGDAKGLVMFRVSIQVANLAVVTSQSLWGSMRFRLNQLVLKKDLLGLRLLVLLAFCLSLMLAVGYALLSPVVVAFAFGSANASFPMAIALSGYVGAASLNCLINLLSPGVVAKSYVVAWQGATLALLLVIGVVGCARFGGMGPPFLLSFASWVGTGGLLVSTRVIDGKIKARA